MTTRTVAPPVTSRRPGRRLGGRRSGRRPGQRSKASEIWQYRTLYLLILPTIAYFVVFAYLPM
ncbi:MAG TPA: hypothetical protein VE287_08950, partial [Actinopolymorphaceae bacterium]|nr:hypothetical protein [Actinopolymorphaceae bacterium]